MPLNSETNLLLTWNSRPGHQMTMWTIKANLRLSRCPLRGAVSRKITMQENNKEITRLIKAMTRNLRKQFGVDVPHSALRASFLLASGENPHAFAGKREESGQQRPDVEARVLFDWVYSDESGGTVEALVNLTSGKIAGMRVPSDLAMEGAAVQTRVVLCLEDSDAPRFQAYYRRESESTGYWSVTESDLPQIRRWYFVDSWRVPVGLFPEDWHLPSSDGTSARWYCVVYNEDADNDEVQRHHCRKHGAEFACREVEEYFPHAEILRVEECVALDAPTRTLEQKR
jgi:hypothetical protein